MKARPSDAPLPASSYGLLAHLASRPMAASELVRRMATGSPSFYIPRAESMVYAQVKELAERGLATASRDASTRRARTVYAITDAGREALRAYLCETASGVFRLDWPALLKVAFGHLVPRPVLLRHIDALAAELDEHRAGADEVLGSWAERGFEFPERAHLSMLIGDLHLRLADTIAGWLADARRETEHPPTPRQRAARLQALRARSSGKGRT